MKRTASLLTALAVSVCLAPSMGAQEAPAVVNIAAKQLPPVKPLGPVFAKSAQLVDAVSAVRQLPGGRLLVNDIVGRKVVLFDSTLTRYTVVADTTSATANAYSSRAGGLVAWKGDSTLFVDPLSLSMLVINGKGSIARVMSTPRASDATLLIGGPNGTPGVDAAGRLIYRGQVSRGGRGGFVWNGGQGGGQGGAQHSHDEGATASRGSAGGGEGDHSHNEGGGRGGFSFGGGDGPGRGNFGAGRARSTEVQPINMVTVSELTDYIPPFTPGAARGDMDGNLWVRTTRGINGGSIYDVISAKGLLLKRVLLPAGRVIAGFGKGGVVYMGVREEGRVRLEAAKSP